MTIFLGQDALGNAVEYGVSSAIPGVTEALPFTAGTVFHVKPSSGLDTNNGLTPDTAFKTLVKALAAATANKNDIVVLHAESNTAASTTDYQAATLDWNKDMVHLIGANAGSFVSQRSRVALISTYVTASNLFTLSADGCLIRNISFFAGVASAIPTGCFKLTGMRNVIERCHLAGVGHDDNDIAGAYSLLLDGGAENVFKNCAIGLDTIARGTAANSEILVDGSATRNLFEDCLIYRMIEHGTNAPLVKLADATAIDRWLWFRRCMFHSESVNYATAQAGVFKLVADLTQGYIIAEDCKANAGKAATVVKWDVDDRDKILLYGSAIAPADTAGIERQV